MGEPIEERQRKFVEAARKLARLIIPAKGGTLPKGKMEWWRQAEELAQEILEADHVVGRSRGKET